jgi:3-oxoisoapionate decarboxylase
MTVRFGLDVYSLRSQGWSPFEQLDYCARQGVQVVHFSEIGLMGGLEPAHLRRVREHADRLGLELEIGMRSIAPGATIFDPSQGGAEEQLLRVVEAAGVVGSSIVRCVVGRFVDRTRPGGIERLIAETVQVLRNVRAPVEDADVRIAVENHAGDLQARELKALVEAAGPGFVGVCIDSGNALWALEDPHLTLETLAPYVLTSHVRDGAVWHTDTGVAVAWTPMGEGHIGISDFVRAYLQQCPGRALTLEIIVPDTPRYLPYRDPQFWEGYRQMPAWEFGRFLAHATFDRPDPPHASPALDAAARDLLFVERSIAWTRRLLALT